MRFVVIDHWLSGTRGVSLDAIDERLHLMDDADLRLRLGRSARARVLERYRLSQNTGRMAEIYRRRI